MSFTLMISSLAGYHSVFAADQPCVVQPQANAWSYNASEKNITGRFVVSGGGDCTQPVSVMSWNADASLLPDSSFWTTQSIYKVSTATFGVGENQLTVDLPVCANDPQTIRSYQADIIASENPSPYLSPPGTGSDYDRSQNDGSSIVVSSVVGDNKCPQPVVAQVTVIPTITSTPQAPDPPASPPKPISYATPSTPAPKPVKTSSVKPTSLPNTGPGSTIAIIVGVSVLAGLLHYVRFRAPKPHHHIPEVYFPDFPTHHHPEQAHQQPHHSAVDHYGHHH
jgi:hypothetical protein